MIMMMYILMIGLSGGVAVLLFRAGRVARLVHRALRREIRVKECEFLNGNESYSRNTFI